jgi:hypothetical protein
MQPNRRRHPPPYRADAFPPSGLGHPTRRQFAPSPFDTYRAAVPRRYRLAHDGAGDPRVSGSSTEGVILPRRRRRGVLHTLRRRTPLRDGLVGLAMVGAATPLAMSRLGSLRTDPAHENTIPLAAPIRPLTDATVGTAWRTASDRIESERQSARDTMIEEKVQRYADLGLDRELAATIYDIALENDIDPDVAFGLVRTESEFKPTARSHVGAIGLTQLMPATARWMRPGTTASDLHEPEVNVRIGFKYLRELIDKYDGNQRLALLAYNRGPGTVDRVLKRGGDPDNGYAEAVISGEGVHR